MRVSLGVVLIWLPPLAALQTLSVPELRNLVSSSPADGSFRKRTSFLKPEGLQIRFCSNNAEIQLLKQPGESVEHVLMKAMLWELFRDDFPKLRVEPPAPEPGRFVPDLLCKSDKAPLGVEFWGECGKTDLRKILALARDYPAALLVVAKYRIALQGYAASLRRELKSARTTRMKPVLLVAFPDDSLERYFADDGNIQIRKDDEHLQWASL